MVANLASHVLGLAVRRVRQDWKERYGYEPLLAETFVEEAQHQGTCYRAANWEEVGRTQGRGRQDEAHEKSISVKRVFVYKLDRQARKQLCVATPESAAAKPRPKPRIGRSRVSGIAWTQYWAATDGDRTGFLSPPASADSGRSEPSKTKAAYRFSNHRDTEMEVRRRDYQSTQQR
jgi:hypothetical protein